MNPVNTRYWEKRWQDTCGYLIFKDTFSAMDVCNARYRYDRRKDDNFPISFDKTTYTIIKNRLTGTLDKQDFWAAVIAPTQAFFDNDWREYHPRGDEFREINLARLVNDKSRFEHLPKEKRERARMVAGNELMKIMKSEYNKPADPFVPPPLETTRKYESKPSYSDKDVLNSLDEVFEGIRDE